MFDLFRAQKSEDDGQRSFRVVDQLSMILKTVLTLPPARRVWVRGRPVLQGVRIVCHNGNATPVPALQKAGSKLISPLGFRTADQ
jgi:hypothetical protein